MQTLNVLWTALAAVATLFLLTKAMGNRQMSQLTMFDYVMGISIGSIAAEMATNIEGDALEPFIGMIVFAAVDVCINLVNNKSRKLRTFFLGKTLVLYDSGTLYFNNLRRAKLDLSEFLSLCRNAGYFNLSQLQLVMMELNGKLSFLPNAGDRPATPNDMQLEVAKTRPEIPIVMDGKLQPAHLKASGNDERWLQKQMKIQGFSDYAELLLATVDRDNNLSLYEMNEDKTDKNIYS